MASSASGFLGFLPVALVYAGLLTLFCGLVCVLRVRTRRRGLVLAVVGLTLAVAGWVFPATERRVAEPRTRLDAFAPVFQFREIHSVEVRASRERVERAIRTVTADEILLFRTLIWIRRFGRPGPESILNPSEQMPLLEVATRTTFLELAHEPGREIVVGTLVIAPPGWPPTAQPNAERFRALDAPGFAKATMNFLIEDAAPGVSRVTTETRVYATDASTRRAFASYWRVIYPGSALIRRMWLRAIRQRAEQNHGTADARG